MVTQEVNRILKRYNHDATDIIAILQDVQHTYRYLPEDVLHHLSGKLDIPLSRIYHLATFFRAFSLEKRGEHEIHVCMGTACHVRGAPRILEALERDLDIPAGKTTADLSCTLETVNCVGACALGPVIVVDEESKGKMNPQKAERIVSQMGLGKKAADKTNGKPARGKVKTQAKSRAKTTKKAAPKAKAAKPKASGTKKKASGSRKGRK